VVQARRHRHARAKIRRNIRLSGFVVPPRTNRPIRLRTLRHPIAVRILIYQPASACTRIEFLRILRTSVNAIERAITIRIQVHVHHPAAADASNRLQWVDRAFINGILNAIIVVVGVRGIRLPIAV
jgi:hypothetical protein